MLTDMNLCCPARAKSQGCPIPQPAFATGSLHLTDAKQSASGCERCAVLQPCRGRFAGVKTGGVRSQQAAGMCTTMQTKTHSYASGITALGGSRVPEERTMAMIFLPVKPKAEGDTLAYFFKPTCSIQSPLVGNAMPVNCNGTSVPCADSSAEQMASQEGRCCAYGKCVLMFLTAA